MADVSYETLLPQVLPYAVGVPEPTAITAIRNTSIEFLRRTHELQKALTPVSVVSGTEEYTISVPAGYELVTVRVLYFNDAKLFPASELSIRHLRSVAQTGTPKGYYLKLDRTLTLFPKPDVAGTLTGTVVLCPTLTSTGVDQAVVDKHLESLSAGALSRLLLVPNEPYYEPQLALMYRKRFDTAIADARARKNESLVSASLQVQFGRW